MVGFILAHHPWNDISQLKLPQAPTAAPSDFVLPSTMTYRIIRQREYSLTLDALYVAISVREET